MLFMESVGSAFEGAGTNMLGTLVLISGVSAWRN